MLTYPAPGSSGTRGQKFGLSLYLHPYIVKRAVKVLVSLGLRICKDSCADPESFVRENVFLCVCVFVCVCVCVFAVFFCLFLFSLRGERGTKQKVQ